MFLDIFFFFDSLHVLGIYHVPRADNFVGHAFGQLCKIVTFQFYVFWCWSSCCSVTFCSQSNGFRSQSKERERETVSVHIPESPSKLWLHFLLSSPHIKVICLDLCHDYTDSRWYNEREHELWATGVWHLTPHRFQKMQSSLCLFPKRRRPWDHLTSLGRRKATSTMTAWYFRKGLRRQNNGFAQLLLLLL